MARRSSAEVDERPARRRFGQGLLEAFRVAGRATKVTVAVGFVVLLVYWVTGLPLMLLVIVAVIAYIACRQGRVSDLMPSADELESADDERYAQDQEAWEASGQGDQLYNSILLELNAMQNENVTVMLGDLGMVSGELGMARNIADEPGIDEIMHFQVGEGSGGFEIDRDRYTAPGAVMRWNEHDGLELRGADGDSLVIYVHAMDTGHDEQDGEE